MNGVSQTIDYRFFLSYSRRDAKEQGQTENAWFIRFRKDLIRDVAKEATLPASVPEEEVGFYDREGIDLADPWRDALLDGLQQSRVIVCLYSQNYFASEYCGKEVQVFLRRQAENPGIGAHAVIPVLWDAPTKLPEPLPASLAGAQFTHKSLGDMYAEKGLLHLLRMEEEREYQKFLVAIADRIAKAGLVPLPAAKKIEPLDKIASAFHPAASLATSQAGAIPKGVKAAWMVYVAGAQAEYAKRTHRNAYGNESFEWQPYHPDSDGIVGALAANVVSSKGLSPAALAIDNDLSARLREAETKNTMVLILVDPWAVEIATYDHVFASVDRHRLDNCGVIIPWSPNDPELREIDPDEKKLEPETTKTRGKVLEERLSKSLWHIWDSKDVVFVKRVDSEAKFKLAIGRAIEEIRKRISKRGHLLRGEAGKDDFPRLPPGTASTSATASSGDNP